MLLNKASELDGKHSQGVSNRMVRQSHIRHFYYLSQTGRWFDRRDTNPTGLLPVMYEIEFSKYLAEDFSYTS